MDIHVGMVVSPQEMCALKHVVMVLTSEIINVMMVIQWTETGVHRAARLNLDGIALMEPLLLQVFAIPYVEMPTWLKLNNAMMEIWLTVMDAVAPALLNMAGSATKFSL